MSAKQPSFWLGDVANIYGTAHNPGPHSLVGGFVLEVIDDARRMIAVCKAALETDDAPLCIVQDALHNIENRLEWAHDVLEKLPELRHAPESQTPVGASVRDEPEVKP